MRKPVFFETDMEYEPLVQRLQAQIERKYDVMRLLPCGGESAFEIRYAPRSTPITTAVKFTLQKAPNGYFVCTRVSYNGHFYFQSVIFLCLLLLSIFYRESAGILLGLSSLYLFLLLDQLRIIRRIRKETGFFNSPKQRAARNSP